MAAVRMCDFQFTTEFDQASEIPSLTADRLNFGGPGKIDIKLLADMDMGECLAPEGNHFDGGTNGPICIVQPSFRWHH